MSDISSAPRLGTGHPLIALAALLACTAMGAAQAATTIDAMQATGSHTLDGAPVTALSQSYPADGDPVDVYDFTSNGTSGAGLHSYGSTTGQFGSRSSGYGVYDVTGGFSLGLTITNSAAIAQRATFSFYITPGLLSNDLGGYTGLGDVLTFQVLDNGCGGDCVLPGAGDRPPMPGSAPLFAPPAAALSGNQFVESGISFDIRKDGSSVWNSSAALRTDAATGTKFSQTGVDLYGGSGSFRSIAGGAYAVDLGTLAAGQSITLTYDLKTHARGDAAAANADFITLPGREIVVPDQWIEACGDCDQNGPQLLTGGTINVPERNAPALPSGSQSSSGDPFEVFLDGRIEVNSFVPRPALPPGTEPFSVSFAAPVPEPSTWASMGLGLALVVLAKRRRRED